MWGRFSRRNSNGEVQVSRATPSRSVPISLGLREALPWLLVEPSSELPQVGAAGEVLDSIRFEFTGPGIRDYEDLQVAIDGGNWAAQDGGWRECQEGNNTASWGGGTCLQ